MAYNGHLNANAILASLFNMIISQETFADNIYHGASNLVDEARVDGTLLGDTRTYVSVDCLPTHPWGNDLEASNLLALERPKNPNVQAITLNVFRQIRLTIDAYLSKQAWANITSFMQFTSVIVGMMEETRKVYENTTYNTFIGNTIATGAGQSISLSLTLPAGVKLGSEEANRLRAQFLAKSMADLFDELQNYSRNYNDLGYLRSYSPERIKVYWRNDIANTLTLVDLPTIFHDEKVAKAFRGEKLNHRYFGGGISTASLAAGTGKRLAQEYTIGSGANAQYLFPGDLIPSGISANSGLQYTESSSVVAIVLVKLPPFMSSFRVMTSFFNPRSLTDTKFLTLGHNTLVKFDNYPFIRVSLSVAEASE